MRVIAAMATMHQGAVGSHSTHLGAPGVRSGAWQGRAGRETGASYGIHSLAHTSDQRERRGYQAAQVLAGAAGRGSGANYEVVTKGQSTAFVRTPPFANESLEWKHATKRLPPSGAHVTQRAGHNPDSMTRDEFQATTHAKHVPTPAQEHPLLDALREQVCLRGPVGVGALMRKFRAMDLSGDRLLSFNEFAKGILEEGLTSSVDDCRNLFRIFDTDATGNVDYREMVTQCCGALSDRRRAVVMGVFRALDPASTGSVMLSELLGNFDARAHPGVRMGQCAAEDVQREFLGMFDVGPKRRNVSFAEFELFYRAMSVVIEEDKNFDSVVQDPWQLPGELFA